MLELIQQIQQGDKECFEQIVQQYSTLVKAVCRNFYLPGADYDDLYQEGLIALFMAVQSYSPEHDIAFESFARVVIRRKLISAVKQSRRKKHEHLNCSLSIFSKKYENITILETLRDPSYQELILDIEQPFSMEDFLSKFGLSPFEEQILLLFLEGLSYEQMGERTNCGHKSIDNAMQRIRGKIRKYYERRLIAI